MVRLPSSDPSAEPVFKAILVEVATKASVVVREGISEVGWTGGGEIYAIATNGSRIDDRE